MLRAFVTTALLLLPAFATAQSCGTRDLIAELGPEDRAELDAAILRPVADFTADPAPTTDAIVWTPTDPGDYAYTCDVPAHVVMTGRIVVAAGSVL